jgi:hypothetical protein
VETGMATERHRDKLLPLIVERAWNGGFSISDFWRDEYKEIIIYPLTSILKTCEVLIDRGLMKQQEDGMYVPDVQLRELKEIET